MQNAVTRPDPEELISDARDLYVDQFRDFLAGFQGGSAEAVLELDDDALHFGGLRRADHLSEHGVAHDLDVARRVDFRPIEGPYGDAALRIASLSWDDLVVVHDAPVIAPDLLQPWFDQWFDPADQRHELESAVALKVHALVVEPAEIWADLGTAPPEALWTLVELVSQAGALDITLTRSRLERR